MKTSFDWYQISLLALTLWREARGESYDAQVAVACSVRTRVKNPRWWGHDYNSVLTLKWQYSSMTALHDPQLVKFPATGDEAFRNCLKIAELVYDGIMNSPLPGDPDSYHDNTIMPPEWASQCVGEIGAFKFYRTRETEHV